MSISKADAEILLAPYRSRLYGDISDGVMNYNTYYRERAYIHTPRTKANIRRHHVVARIKESFEGEPNTAFIDKDDGLFLLAIYNPILNQSLAIRFKKLDNTLRTSNIRTIQVEMFDDPDEQLELPEMPPRATYVNAGYTLDKVGTAAKKVYVTCPDGPNSFCWIICLDEEITSQPIVILPTPPITGLPPKRRVRVKGESDLDRKRADESGD
jgi:hypothetical protein